MPDPLVPEAAVDAVLVAYPADQYNPQIAVNARGILTAAAPHIGAAYLRWAAQQIRDTHPTPIVFGHRSDTYNIGVVNNAGAITVGGDHPDEYAATGRAVVDWLDHMATWITEETTHA